MKNIKIIVFYHKKAPILKNDVLIPMHVGRSVAFDAAKDFNSLSKEDIDFLKKNMIGDDTGDNISNLNRFFSEMTGIYWCWKNYSSLEDPEYIGFFHYSRQMIFSNNDIINLPSIENINEFIQFMGLNRKDIEYQISDNDIILRKRSILNYDMAHYKKNKKFGYEFNKASEYIEDKYPEYNIQTYLNQNKFNRANIFIMKKEIFFHYCEFIFDVLFYIYKSIDYSYHSINQRRSIGYVGELYLTLFVNHCKNNNKKVKELPIVGNKSISHKIEIQESYIPIVIPLSLTSLNIVAVLIRSIIDNYKSKNKCIFYIIINNENSISNTRKCLLNDLIENEYFSLQFITLEYYFNRFKNLKKIDNISFQTTLLIPIIFNKLQKVIFINPYSIVLTDIKLLYDIDIESFYAGAVIDYDEIMNIKNEYDKQRVINKNIKNITSSTFKIYNPNILLLNIVNINKNRYIDFIKNVQPTTCLTYSNYKKIFHNFYKDSIKEINSNWNVPSRSKKANGQFDLPAKYELKLRDSYLAPKIINFEDRPKPNEEIGHNLDHFFWKYAKFTPFYEEIILQTTNAIKDLKLFLQEKSKIKSIGVNTMTAEIKQREETNLNNFSVLHTIINSIYIIRGDVFSNRKDEDMLPLVKNKLLHFYTDSFIDLLLTQSDSFQEIVNMLADNDSKLIYLSEIKRKILYTYFPSQTADNFCNISFDYKKLKSQYIEYKIEKELINAKDINSGIQSTCGLYIIDNVFTVDEGDIIFDLGAYDGMTAIHFSKLTGPKGKVYAFEPQPETYVYLKKNVTHINNIIPVNECIYHSNTQLNFSCKAQSAKIALQGEYTVKTTTLQHYITENNIKKVDLIKMDIEGSEMHALFGSIDIIKQHRPKLAICIYHNKGEDLLTVPLYLKRNLINYKFYIRKFWVNAWDTILFAVPYSN